MLVLFIFKKNPGKHIRKKHTTQRCGDFFFFGMVSLSEMPWPFPLTQLKGLQRGNFQLTGSKR